MSAYLESEDTLTQVISLEWLYILHLPVSASPTVAKRRERTRQACL